MRVFRGFHHPGIAKSCALTIGNFDGVHRGHQAMLALLTSEARHRGLPSCVLTFEPHPRDYFAALRRQAGHGAGAHRDPARQADRAGALRHRADRGAALRPAPGAAQSPEAFIDDVLVRGLGARYVLVGDDFRFGAKRAGDYAMLDAAGDAAGFDVARMNELRGARPARVELGGARGAGRRRHGARGGAAGPAVQHQRPRAARPQARAASLGLSAP